MRSQVSPNDHRSQSPSVNVPNNAQAIVYLQSFAFAGAGSNSFIPRPPRQISGTGDVLEPEDGIIGIGSGGNYALAAAKVLIETDMKAEEIARKALKVASDICVFTNNNVTLEKL